MSESNFKQSDTNNVPEAVLLVGTYCQHCTAVLGALTELVKQGAVASLEVVNLDIKPEVAERLGVKTVPWTRIGWFELEGLHSKTELKQWAELAGTGAGAIAYFSDMLAAGQVTKVLSIVKKQPDLISYMFDMLADADAIINVRLGVGVVMEEYAKDDSFSKYIPRLGELSKHEDARVRSDACHYLSLTEHSDAVPYITALLDDTSDEVREVAKESMEALNVIN